MQLSTTCPFRGACAPAALALPPIPGEEDPMLDIHWLHTFVTLVWLQHSGQTATELHMTQPNVSRTSRTWSRRPGSSWWSAARLPDPGGERLLQSAERAINELQLCQSDLNAPEPVEPGDARHRRQRHHLAPAADPAVPALQAGLPGIDLTLFNTTSDQAADLVRAGKADLGFVDGAKAQ